MTHRFRSFDGVTIAYQQWGTRDDTPPVILHHGFVVDATTNWVHSGVVKALIAAGRWAVGIDARGHGQSDKPHTPASYGEEAMARDLATLLNVLAVESVDLVGYSLGAVVAAVLAGRDRRIRRLVLGGVGCAMVELGGLDRRAMPAEAVAAALLADDPESLTGNPAAPLRALADAVGADRRALAAHIGMAHAKPLPLDRITAPTLVLCGAQDPLAARPHVLVDALPHATLRVLPGDHLSVVRDPGFVPAIVDFLAATD